MTTAPFTSEWYRILVNYKRGHPELWETAAALIHTFIENHASRIGGLLGGAFELITPVPSKRGVPYERQPLQRVLHGIASIRDAVCQALTHRPGSQLARWRYSPGTFDPGAAGVRGRRVLLIEDAWVTGATCLSAAGALLEQGAVSVVVLALARCIDEEFWRHRALGYLEAISSEYDPGAWPR